MESKNFGNESDARKFRDSKRDEGHAASLYTYGKNRYKVKVLEYETKEKRDKTQRWLSHQSWRISNDIEDLTKVKELIESPDFGSDIEDSVLVAKKLEEQHFFPTTKSVINFFDDDYNLAKIKELVDTSLNEYDSEWNEVY